MTRRLVIAAAGAAALALPAAAAAAPSGSASLEISLPVAQSLETRGVAVSAVAPAERSARLVVVPVRSASVGTSATLGVGGQIKLKRGKRAVSLTKLRVVLGARTSITAVLAGKRTTVWTLAPKAGAVRLEVATATAQLSTSAATLTAAAERTIRKKLGGGKALPRKRFLTLAVDAAGDPPAAGAPGAPVVPAGTPCKALGTGGPPPDTGAGEPAVKARPASAIDIAGAAIQWHVRDSFVQYINAGEGTLAADGAVADAPEVRPGSDASLTYSFRFPFARGWCDPVTGKAAIYGKGSVAFRYKAHGIDLVVNDPEIEIDGASSRVIFRMTGSGDTDGHNKRQVVEVLDPSKAASIVAGPDGKSFTYAQVPGAIPKGADASVFAGYYLPGDPFGWLSVAFTTN